MYKPYTLLVLCCLIIIILSVFIINKQQENQLLFVAQNNDKVVILSVVEYPNRVAIVPIFTGPKSYAHVETFITKDKMTVHIDNHHPKPGEIWNFCYCGGYRLKDKVN